MGCAPGVDGAPFWGWPWGGDMGNSIAKYLAHSTRDVWVARGACARDRFASALPVGCRRRSFRTRAPLNGRFVVARAARAARAAALLLTRPLPRGSARGGSYRLIEGRRTSAGDWRAREAPCDATFDIFPGSCVSSSRHGRRQPANSVHVTVRNGRSPSPNHVRRIRIVTTRKPRLSKRKPSATPSKVTRVYWTYNSK